MRLIALLIAMMFSSICTGYAQSNKSSLDQMLKDYEGAVAANDASAAASFMADDYTFISPQGIVMDKHQRTKLMKSGKVKFDSFTYEDVNVKMYGNTAIVYKTIKAKFSDSKQTRIIASTTVLVFKDNRWQIVASQATPVVG